jgi:hypothetical protein
MNQSTKDIPDGERARLLPTDASAETADRGYNDGASAAPAFKKHLKRRNSDGSLDFERIVNGYSIQGEQAT